MSKEELAVEVAEIDGVKIDYVYFGESSEDKVFEQLTSYSTSTDEQDLRLDRSVSQGALSREAKFIPA